MDALTARHQWWIRQPKLNEKKKACWVFIFFGRWCRGWRVEWLTWCGSHTSIICNSGVLHYGMYHWISWRVTNPTWFSLITITTPNHQTDLGAALLWPHSGLPKRLRASAVTGSQSPSDFILETVAPVDLDSLQPWGFKAPDTHGATFTLCCISVHLFRRGILEILKSKENYNKMLKNNRVRCVFCVSGKTLQDIMSMLFCF